MSTISFYKKGGKCMLFSVPSHNRDDFIKKDDWGNFLKACMKRKPMKITYEWDDRV